MSQTDHSLSHSKWDGKDHVVFVPKRRRQALDGNIRQALGPLFDELALKKECQLLEGHLRPDHLHLVMETRPKHAVASSIGFLKGQSAMAMARQFAGQERNLTGEHCWARGYAVSTVGLEEEEVRRDVREQDDEDEGGRF